MRQYTLLPELLLNDPNLSPSAKLVYAVTQIYSPASIADLARLCAIRRPTASHLCDQLAKQGWILKVKKGRLSTPTPAIPHQIQEQMVRDLYAAYGVSQYKGEFLSKAWMGHLILTDDYQDNVRLPSLQNPETGEFLELDRYFPSLNAGAEFMGPQHFGPTKAYPNPAQFKKLRTNDLLKRALCEEAGITLITVTADDLSLQRMLELFPKRFPIRQVDPDGPYIKALTKLSDEYRAGLTRALSREAGEQRQ